MTIQHHNYHNLDFLDQTLRKNKSFECKKLVRVTIEKTFPWAYLAAGRGGNWILCLQWRQGDFKQGGEGAQGMGRGVEGEGEGVQEEGEGVEGEG